LGGGVLCVYYAAHRGVLVSPPRPPIDGGLSTGWFERAEAGGSSPDKEITMGGIKFEPYKYSNRVPPVPCCIFIRHGQRHENGYRGTIAGVLIENPFDPGDPSDPDNGYFTMYYGLSICSPEDEFLKVTGRHKALGRAFRAHTARHLPDNIRYAYFKAKFQLDEVTQKRVGMFLEGQLEESVIRAGDTHDQFLEDRAMRRLNRRRNQKT